MKVFKSFLALFLFLACFQTARADWTKQKSNTLAWLRDVYFLNDQAGWIVGSGGTFLSTKDGGGIWTRNKHFNDDTIRQVYFTDEQNGWLLCERDLFALGKNSPSYLLKTVDGGATWEQVELANPQRRRITKIFFDKYDSGIAIGEGGTFFAMSGDKKAWKQKPSPARFLLFDGLFTGEWNGVVVGAGGAIFFTEDAGLSWTKANLVGESKAKLNAVFFINQRNGWTVGTEGKIFQTLNGGKIWREQKSSVAKDLTSVFFNSTAEGWAVGNEGTILHTMTAGNVWTVVDSKAKHNLEKVLFVGKKGWAVGFGGTILTYDEANAQNNLSSFAPQLKVRN
ncbi:MAG: hypothetical protein LH472_08385 [Pyrinomonadaceae bacterium]|nr:hypothetical protein [Pyrinomonadaceae bacterium]